MRWYLYLLLLASSTASAEQIRIPWKGDYAHNADATYSADNKYRSGLSKNFLNGAPEENGKIQKDGYLLVEVRKPKRKDDPLPFVVLMHGCTGLTPLVAKWADEKSGAFLSQGYGVLILNSFGSRNVDKVCGDGNYHWGLRRAEDAYSALNYLIENKIAKPDEIYVMGRSNGGTAALMIGNALQVRSHQYRFAGVFAVSPGCAGMEKFKFAIPTTIFIGDRDQANDPKVCERLKDSGSVRIVLYKGVHHGYEDKTRPYRQFGWQFEYNAKADKETIEQTLASMKARDFQRGVELR